MNIKKFFGVCIIILGGIFCFIPWVVPRVPLVSVVVPVYNTAPYLERCLNSLINQTLKDIEIICVNDGSTDNSLEILQKYAKKDSRVKVVNFKKNSGLATARNAALMVARGRFVSLVDSDDFVDPDYHEMLYKYGHHFDVVKPIVLHNGIYYPNFKRYIVYTPGMIRRDVIFEHSIFFRDIKDEDVDFYEQLLQADARFFILKDIGTYYHYERRYGSLSLTKIKNMVCDRGGILKAVSE